MPILPFIFLLIVGILNEVGFVKKARDDAFVQILPLLILIIAASYIAINLDAEYKNLKIAIEFANPFSSSLKEITDTNTSKINNNLSTITITWIAYKGFFILIGYHLVVSLKRITKF